MKKSLYLSLIFLEGFLIGTPAYAQSEQERYEAYDRCQVDVQTCQKAAEHGDAQAQYNLGKMYYAGEGLPQNFQKTKILWEESSKKGSAQSLNGLGLLYYTGEGVQGKNVKLAKELFHKAAQLGEFKAVLNIKVMLENNFAEYDDLKNADEEFRHFHEINKIKLENLSNNGNADASYKLALMYGGYDKIQQYDQKKYIYYLKKAAQEGNADAQYEIGYIYFRGTNNVKVDRDKAFKYLIESDKQDNSNASYALFEYYQYQHEPDSLRSSKYLEKAAERHNLQAVHKMAYFYYHGNDSYKGNESFPKIDFKKAFHYYQVLSTTLTNRGIYYLGKDYQLDAMYQLGVMYVNGQGVNKSIQKAIVLFKTSCDKGYKNSCDELSHLK